MNNIEKSVKLENHILKNYVTKINNDVNGNPRYYIGLCELASLLNVDFCFIKQNYKKLSELTKYRGKQYGYGYVICTYNLADTFTDWQKNSK